MQSRSARLGLRSVLAQIRSASRVEFDATSETGEELEVIISRLGVVLDVGQNRGTNRRESGKGFWVRDDVYRQNPDHFRNEMLE